MIQLAVAGARGRMGRCVLELADRDDRFEIAAALTKDTAVGWHGQAQLGRGIQGERLSNARPDKLDRATLPTVRVGDRDVVVTETLDTPCDVLIDFTVADGTMAWLEVCRQRGIPMVIGATGHDDQQLSRIHEAAQAIPILKAANFSVGTQAILSILGRLATELGEAYDIEIVEAHHRDKLDAPSGTALALVDELAAAVGRMAGAGPGSESPSSVVFGRHGRTGERPAGQIGVHAMRMGDVVSQHEIHFGGPGETVTVSHVAHSYETFAAGALHAAAWLIGKQPGLYTMRDVIG